MSDDKKPVSPKPIQIDATKVIKTDPVKVKNSFHEVDHSKIHTVNNQNKKLD